MFVIPGAPITLQRPRFSFKTHHAYDPQAKERKLISTLIQRQCNHPPLEGALTLSATFYMPIPKSQPKCRPLQGLPCITHKDLDNMIKWILDCSNTILFSDDSQIYCISAQKIYDHSPRTEFTLLEHLPETTICPKKEPRELQLTLLS